MQIFDVGYVLGLCSLSVYMWTKPILSLHLSLLSFHLLPSISSTAGLSHARLTRALSVSRYIAIPFSADAHTIMHSVCTFDVHVHIKLCNCPAPCFSVKAYLKETASAINWHELRGAQCMWIWDFFSVHVNLRFFDFFFWYSTWRNLHLSLWFPMIFDTLHCGVGQRVHVARPIHRTEQCLSLMYIKRMRNYREYAFNG